MYTHTHVHIYIRIIAVNLEYEQFIFSPKKYNSNDNFFCHLIVVVNLLFNSSNLYLKKSE